MKTGTVATFAAGALMALAVACGSEVEPTPTPWPTPDNSTMSRIAFASNRDGNWEIYLMNSDGSNPHNVTNNPATDSHPSWSPDGSKIVFQSERAGNFEIYVMNSDGSEQKRLTEGPGRRPLSRVVARRHEDRLRIRPARTAQRLDDEFRGRLGSWKT